MVFVIILERSVISGRFIGCIRMLGPATPTTRRSTRQRRRWRTRATCATRCPRAGSSPPCGWRCFSTWQCRARSCLWSRRWVSWTCWFPSPCARRGSWAPPPCGSSGPFRRRSGSRATAKTPRCAWPTPLAAPRRASSFVRAECGPPRPDSARKAVFERLAGARCPRWSSASSCCGGEGGGGGGEVEWLCAGKQ